MSIRLNRPIKGSLQIVFEKANKQEFIIIVKREVKKETGLSVI